MQIEKIIEIAEYPEIIHNDIWANIDFTVPDGLGVCICIQDRTRWVNHSITRAIIRNAIAGCGAENVQVVVANGMHRACTHRELAAYLGDDICRLVDIRQNNPHKGIDQVGPFFVVGIHCSMPHTSTLFSSVGKMYSVGIQGYDEVKKFHQMSYIDKRTKIKQDSGCFDYIIDFSVDHKQRIISYFCGEYSFKYNEYLIETRKKFCVDPPKNKPDVALLRPNRCTDFILSMNAMNVTLRGDVVKKDGIICIASEAREMGVHYLFEPGTVCYDQVFEKAYDHALPVFIMPYLREYDIQKYFKKRIFNFPTYDRFVKFVESRYGDNPIVHSYIGSDIMIGDTK